MTPDLTKAEVAAELNISPRTVANYLAKRLLPHYRIPAGPRIRRVDLDAFKAARSFGHPQVLSAPRG